MSQNNDSSHDQLKDSNNCPLNQIPVAAWEKIFNNLLKPPFRKRHPIIFWVGVVFILITIFSIFNIHKDQDQLSTNGDSLALIQIKGVIMDPSDTLKWIRRIEHCDQIKGVLLRVDSPGGGAAASQELYTALKRLAKQKKIVVSMGQMAASGGLMVSMASEHIFANASTVTGSIGVRMDLPLLKGLFEKLGIDQQTLTTGPYKGAGSYLKPLTSEEKEYFQGILNDMHEQFIEIVATSRKIPTEKVKELATGKIYTGREALKLGLIDEIGGQEEAHAWLAKATNIDLNKKLITKPRSEKWFEEILKSLADFNFLSALDLPNIKKTIKEEPIFLYQF